MSPQRGLLLCAAVAVAAAVLVAPATAGYVWRAVLSGKSFHWGEAPPWPAFNLVNSLAVRWLPLLQAKLLPPHVHAALLATAFVPAKALYTVTALGVADALEEGPQHVSQLAARAGVQDDALRRILRAVAAHGIFDEVSPGVFRNNRGSSVLRGDHPASLRRIIMTWGDDSYWAHERMLESLAPGSPPAFQLQSGGVPYFEWLDLPENRNRSANFNRAMEDAARSTDAATLADYPWERHANQTLSDVGGGIGAFLASLLSHQPSMRGLLVDRPSVVADAEGHWRYHHASLLDRVSFLEGDFFASLPPADVHFARYILHDWADAEAAAILRTVRAAVPRGAEGCTTLLVQDAVMPERQPGTLFTTFDLQMLAITGGKERMLGEWSALLGAGGWHLVRVWPLRAATSLIEARPV